MGYLSRLSVVLAVGICTAEAQSNPAAISASGYVDAKRCAPCHREIAVNYARTGMSRSFYSPSPANTTENFAKTPEYYHALSDSHYSMAVRDGEYFQRRWQLDADGKEMNVEELKIDYVMGSGNH